MRPTDLAWLAGYMDGEACFRCDGTTRVTITNTHKPTLEMIQRWFGGKVSSGTQTHSRHRTYWRLQLSGEKARNITRQVLPHLNEKRSQAEILLRYMDSSKQQRLTLQREMSELKRPEWTEK